PCVSPLRPLRCMLPISFFFEGSAARRVLRSFPTRRSSDLGLSGPPPAPVSASGLTSGTTSGQAGSARKAEELSTTNVPAATAARSEEHTSELQSLTNLVCRLLLEKKNMNPHSPPTTDHRDN